MIRLGAIVVAIVGIGLILNPAVPFWLFATAVAILFAARSIWSVRHDPKPLRGATLCTPPHELQETEHVVNIGVAPEPSRPTITPWTCEGMPTKKVSTHDSGARSRRT
jgi:hypothetical protein